MKIVTILHIQGVLRHIYIYMFQKKILRVQYKTKIKNKKIVFQLRSLLIKKLKIDENIFKLIEQTSLYE